MTTKDQVTEVFENMDDRLDNIKEVKGEAFYHAVCMVLQMHSLYTLEDVIESAREDKEAYDALCRMRKDIHASVTAHVLNKILKLSLEDNIEAVQLARSIHEGASHQLSVAGAFDDDR